MTGVAEENDGASKKVVARRAGRVHSSFIAAEERLGEKNMTYIIIDEQVFATNTAEQIEEAKAALEEAGMQSAPVYVGEPDGLGDSYANGEVLFV